METSAIRLLAAPLLALGLASSALAQDLGRLDIVRRVTVLRGGSGSVARHGQGIAAGDQLKTGARSFAEAILTAGSALRLNQHTQLVLSGEGCKLEHGQVWARAVGTMKIETPAATILATDAVVVVGIRGDATDLMVLSGAARMEQDEASQSVKSGERLSMERRPGRVARGAVEEVPPGVRPIEIGGAKEGWWRRIDSERGLLVFAGTRSGNDLRFDPITEAVADIAAIPPPPQAVAVNAGRREKLLSIAQRSINPTLDAELAADPNLSLTTYRLQFGRDYVEDRFKALSASERAFLYNNGLRTVDQLFAGLAASGGSFGQPLPSRPRETKIFDRTSDSTSYLALGLVAGLAGGLGSGGLQSLSMPQTSGMGFGFASDPQAFGGRVNVVGAAGQKLRYQFEGNILQLLNTDIRPDKADGLSQAYIEREMSPGTTVFAGRRRFYAGPVLQNQTGAQLVADRYTGLGFRKAGKGGGYTEVAFLHDANPDRRGSQSGATASLVRQQGSGLVGFHLLNASKVVGGGTGATISLSQPLSAGELDGYAEVGRGVDGQAVATVGVYLSGLAQKSGLDAWIEAGTRQKRADALSLGLAQASSETLTWRAFATFNRLEGRNTNTKVGLGAIFKFN